ncbi:MAG: glycerophosphoryl diester phosphodiesterase [Kiritimatiellia bacterium]|jgi:glycerophosphoryl diester phosphodiesterase
MNTSQLVAHRGYQKCFPENSLIAVMSAIAAGAVNIEVDLQFNDEGLVFLFHDDELSRISGVEACFHSQSSEVLSKLSAYEPARLGEKFSANPIALFAELLPIIRNYQEINFFIELKEASVRRYGAAACIDHLINLMEELSENCILISYSGELLSCAKKRGFSKTGLVIRDWKIRNTLADQFLVDYIIIDYKRIASEVIDANVPVMVYEVDNLPLAQSLIERGAFAVETFCFNDLADAIHREL